jgi:hypothetical protein
MSGGVDQTMTDDRHALDESGSSLDSRRQCSALINGDDAAGQSPTRSGAVSLHKRVLREIVCCSDVVVGRSRRPSAGSALGRGTPRGMHRAWASRVGRERSSAVAEEAVR